MGAFALVAECWRLFRARRENPLARRGGWLRGWLLPMALFAASCAIVWHTMERRLALSGITIGPASLVDVYSWPGNARGWLLLWFRDVGLAHAVASLIVPGALMALLRPRFAREDAIAELRTTPLHPREILFGAAWPMIRAHVAFTAPLAFAISASLVAWFLGLLIGNEERIPLGEGSRLAAHLVAALLAPAVSLLLALREFARERRATLAGFGRIVGGTLAVLAVALLLPRVVTTELIFLYDELWNPIWSSQYNDRVLPSQRWLLLAVCTVSLGAAVPVLLATLQHALAFSAVQFTTLRGDDSLAREWWRGDGVEPTPPLVQPVTRRAAALAACALAVLALVQAALPRPGAETDRQSIPTRIIRSGERIPLKVNMRGHRPEPTAVVFATFHSEESPLPPGSREIVFTYYDRFRKQDMELRLRELAALRPVGDHQWVSEAFPWKRGEWTCVVAVSDSRTLGPADEWPQSIDFRRLERDEHRVPAHPALDAIARGIGIPGGLVVFLFAVAFAALRVPRGSLPAAKPLRWAAQSLSRPAFLFGSALLAAALLEGRMWGPGHRHTLDSYIGLAWAFIGVGGAVFIASMRALLAIPAARNPRLAAALWIIGAAAVALWLNRSAVAAGNMVLLPLTDGTPKGIAQGLLALSVLLHFGFGEALYQRLRDARTAP